MFQKFRRKLSRYLFGEDPDYQDPYEDPAEQFYGRIYLKFLTEAIESEFRGQRVHILDVGCHTGRLSIPLAQAGHEVTGIDSSRFHVRRAEKRARQLGLQCRFLKGDGFGYVRHLPDGLFDLVLCTEVLYQIPDFRERMKGLVRILRPGGLLATSHRSRFFYLSRAVRERNFEAARLIRNQSEGSIWNSYFNWQTPSELQELYRDLGVDSLRMRPIGIFSGNGADGMAPLCHLTELTDSERQDFFEIEADDSDEFSLLARYLLLIGRKRGQ